MEDIMSVIIIVGITVAIAVGAAIWVFGLWHGQQEVYMIKPVAVISSTSSLGTGSAPLLKLYISNDGNKLLHIIKVEIRTSNGSYVNTTPIVVEPQTSLVVEISEWEHIGNPDPVVPGGRYRIYIYTEELGMLFYDIVAS